MYAAAIDIVFLAFRVINGKQEVHDDAAIVDADNAVRALMRAEVESQLTAIAQTYNTMLNDFLSDYISLLHVTAGLLPPMTDPSPVARMQVRATLHDTCLEEFRNAISAFTASMEEDAQEALQVVHSNIHAPSSQKERFYVAMPLAHSVDDAPA